MTKITTSQKIIIGAGIAVFLYLFGYSIAITFFPCLKPNSFSCLLERNVEKLEKLKKQNAENQ